MKPFPIRLTPGQDLRAALEAAVLAQSCRAAFVLSGIGSLSTAGIRLAGADQPTRMTGSMEILTLSGTVAVVDGDKTASHLHMAISTATGQVLGGHVAPGVHRAHHGRGAASLVARLAVQPRAGCADWL